MEVRARDLFGFKCGKMTTECGANLSISSYMCAAMEAHTGQRLDRSHLVGLTCNAFEHDSLGVCS